MLKYMTVQLHGLNVILTWINIQLHRFEWSINVHAQVCTVPWL